MRACGKILIIHHGALGDTLCAWPVFHALAEAFAGREKYFSGAPHLAFLLRPLGFSPLPPALAGAERAFYEPGAGFGPGNGCGPRPDMAVFRFSLDKIPETIPPGATIFRALPEENIHVSATLAAQARTLGLDPPDADRASALFRAAHGIPQGNPGGPAAIFAGAGHKMKQWPAASFAALARIFMDEGLEPAQIMGPRERELGPDLRAALPQISTICPENAAELLDVLSRCRLAVGNDCGPMHLAAMAGIPTLALFGPTSAQRWRPLGPRAHIAAPDAPCAPCSIKADTFGCARPACLERITPQRVWEEILGKGLLA